MDALQPMRLDHGQLRSAGKGVLSLALMASRNRTLAWLDAVAAALGEGALRTLSADAPRDELDPPLWTLGHLGWFQEHWIARHVQRRRGAHAAVDAPRVGRSALDDGDRLYDPARASRAERWADVDALPDAEALRQRVAAILETTLELLDAEPDDSDDALWSYRLAVLHEDAIGEAFAVLAQTVGFEVAADRDADDAAARRSAGPPQARRNPLGGQRPEGAWGTHVMRPPIGLPSMRWQLGVSGGGFAFDEDTGDEAVTIPEFEIDAQAVTWAQYGEFVEDGGYDDADHWSRDGWAWLMANARRTPRHVEQMRHGVLQRRFGRVQRMPAGAPVVHVSHHEASAWCRWAGRRLASEVEWEAAASRGASRGFRHGLVHEWTASTLRPLDGWRPGPWRARVQPWFGVAKVLRGSSRATPASLVGVRRRGFAHPDRDDGFHGFRSCAA